MWPTLKIVFEKDPLIICGATGDGSGNLEKSLESN
jgi:hypothetical protein